MLGSVEMGFQPDPGRRQVQKIHTIIRVFVVAGRQVPPPLEPADAPFHGVAHRVPFRIVGLGVRAPGSVRNDGLNTPPRPPGAEGVAVIDPIRDQAGQRIGSGFPQGPSLGAVMARTTHHAQAQVTASSIRQDVDLGADAAPVAAEHGLPLFVLGCIRRADVCAHDRAVPPHGGQIGLQVGQPARPDAPVALVSPAATDRILLPVLDRPLMPRGPHPYHPAQGCLFVEALRFLVHSYDRTYIHNRLNAEPLDIGHRRDCPLEDRPRDRYPGG